MVNRTKQPEGCIGISEKCVFTRCVFKWVFLAIVVLQVPSS